MAFGQPNYGYPNYGYQNQFNPYQYGQPVVQPQIQNQVTQPTLPQPTQPQISQPQIPTLYGKVVDGIDVVRSLDVPIGASFILPKADGTACYCKGWNVDGTTFIKEYKLVEGDFENSNKTPEINLEEKLDDIYNSIDSLNKKLDKLKQSPAPATRKKKVEEEDDYE